MIVLGFHSVSDNARVDVALLIHSVSARDLASMQGIGIQHLPKDVLVRIFATGALTQREV